MAGTDHQARAHNKFQDRTYVNNLLKSESAAPLYGKNLGALFEKMAEKLSVKSDLVTAEKIEHRLRAPFKEAFLSDDVTQATYLTFDLLQHLNKAFCENSIDRNPGNEGYVTDLRRAFVLALYELAGRDGVIKTSTQKVGERLAEEKKTFIPLGAIKAKLAEQVDKSNLGHYAAKAFELVEQQAVKKRDPEGHVSLATLRYIVNQPGTSAIFKSLLSTDQLRGNMKTALGNLIAQVAKEWNIKPSKERGFV